MSLVLLALAYPDPRARQHALGIWASCNGLAFIVGPTVGGLLVDTVGWRSIFYLILPFCAGALLLARMAVEESAAPEGRHLDVRGQTAAIVALGGLSFATIEGAHLGWTSAPVVVAAAVAAAGAAVFVLVERRTVSGLVPFELFSRRPFSAALSIAGLMTFGMYALLFLMPLYFQTVRGASVVMAGIEMLPLSIAFVVVSRLNGRIVHAIGVRAAMATGMAAMGIGELALAFLSASTSWWLVATALGVVGVGLGLNTAPVNSVAVANVPRERSGTASGLLNTARMVGATLGVAILGSVFAHFAGQEGTVHRDDELARRRRPECHGLADRDIGVALQQSSDASCAVPEITIRRPRPGGVYQGDLVGEALRAAPQILPRGLVGVRAQRWPWTS